jgi:signal transduction histidine kinase
MDTSINRAQTPHTNPKPNKRHELIWCGLMLIGPLALLILTLNPNLNSIDLHSPLAHLIIALAAAISGMILALFVIATGIVAEDARTYLIGLAFLATAGIFSIHAIATPNVLMSGRTIATAWSAPFSLFLGACIFVLSGLNFTHLQSQRIINLARRGIIIYLLFWLIYAGFFLFIVPSIQQSPPSDANIHLHELFSIDHQTQSIFAIPNQLHLAIIILGLAAYTFAIHKHTQIYRQTPTITNLALICGIMLFSQALFIQSISTTYSLAFWLYHILEFMGFGVIGYAVIINSKQARSPMALLEGLLLDPNRLRMQTLYNQGIDSLIDMLAKGQTPTAQQIHNLRLTLGVNQSQLRVLERAAQALAEERRQRQELERLSAIKQELEKNREEFIQMIVHDLKNPLTALIGFLEILGMEKLSESQRMLLDGALRSGKNLAGLVSDLLDTSRLEEGQIDLDRQPFDLAQLLSDCADDLSAWLQQEEKTLVQDVPSELPELIADKRLIRRILMNLLSNAIKHTPVGTTITLRAATIDKKQIKIEVQDNGKGIPAEHLASIFEKFSTLGGETNRRQGSTGLGLTFCRLATEAHKGTISVESTQGQGTTFRILLPLQQTSQIANEKVVNA